MLSTNNKWIDLIVLPKKIEKRLKEESEKTGVSEEEIILEALSKALNEPLDPETKVKSI
jgi:predicted DNA-binding protein